ncbi:MAG: FAD-binding protein [Pseudoflavonifractor sp.]
MKKAIALSLAAALSLSLLTGCTGKPAAPSAAPSAAPQPAAAFTYADTVAWDGQYDVIVVGFGGAGAVAAKTAADAGAKVLIVEKAPEGHEGGNTRYCGQLFVNGNGDYEATLSYYKALAGQHKIPDAMLETYAKSISVMADTLANDFGFDKTQFMPWTGLPVIGSMSPEYPEFPGSDKISLDTTHQGISDAFLWQGLRKNVTDRADSIDVWFESPAVKLVQDPASKTVLGVTVERGGETLNIRANNGVALTCGGFENNTEMLADYLGITRSQPIGTLYNTGDGIRMALDVGADLWHMEAYEGIGDFAGSTVAVGEGERGLNIFGSPFISGSSIFIAGDGNRYLREDELSRHGHIKMGDAWMNVRRPNTSFVVCDQSVFDAANAAKPIPENANVQKAATIAELAALIKVPAETLEATVKSFNGYAKTGVDPQFGRAAESMKPLNGPFVAVEMTANILNTQGGPRRNENAEVLDRDGKAIPHLYSAGELGGITAFQYQGGGNVAECITFGQIAGKNAAAPKTEALPQYQPLQKVDSTLKYTPGAVTDVAAAFDESTLKPGQYLGNGTGMGGPLQVVVTMDGDKISKVEVVTQKETEGIGDKALNAIPDAIVAANSADVDAVASATVTSKAIIEAVKDAMSKIK